MEHGLQLPQPALHGHVMPLAQLAWWLVTLAKHSRPQQTHDSLAYVFERPGLPRTYQQADPWPLAHVGSCSVHLIRRAGRMCPIHFPNQLPKNHLGSSTTTADSQPHPPNSVPPTAVASLTHLDATRPC